jgi:glycosyltransferase involved in cell wall biosynthesis
MRIAITADPFIPVPPVHYGGIERIIDFLVLGLIKRGHDVLLAANKNSSIDAPLLGFPKHGEGLIDHIQNIKVISGLKKFNPDIIHSFSRMAYLTPFINSGIPKLMSYQREPTVEQIKLAKKIFKKGSLSFTGCSNYISKKIEPYAHAKTVYNGLDMAKYTFTCQVSDNAPLLFLGRIEFIKGTHIAINVAKKTGKKLIIAGNVPAGNELYFNEQVKPHLNDDIKYVGPVNDEQKNTLLGNAAALLMPIQWNEPFGIVMVEAMACGTPVIGFDKGALPEVIKNNVNGFICRTEDEMITKTQEIGIISRQDVFDDCRERFSADVIIDNYLYVYQQLINAHVNKKPD